MKCHNLVVKYLKGQPPFANYEVLERKYFYGTLYVSRGAKSCPFCHMTSANKSKINEGTKIFWRMKNSQQKRAQEIREGKKKFGSFEGRC